MLQVVGVNYRYRYCDGCRGEWPAEHGNCPECLRWLGDGPRERTEWQLAPGQQDHSAPARHEFICAAALCLRVVGQRPSERQLEETLHLLKHILIAERDDAVLAVENRGWLVWTKHGARRAFLSGIRLRDRLTASLPALEKALPAAARLRWGIWVDSYVLPCNASDEPIISSTVGAAIFDFEPDGSHLVSESIFLANRCWEQFACVPARRLSSAVGFRSLGRKRPSAVDHARVTERSRFVGRRRILGRLDSLWRASQERTQTAAVVSPAGSGKTRLVSEWLRLNPQISALRANFSIFGGDVASFAGQLAELPENSLDVPTLVAQTCDRIRRERVGVLVVDDLHWADGPASDYLEELFATLPTRGMLILLCTRPSGRRLARKLGGPMEIRLRPLACADVGELAGRLCRSPQVAALAARLAHGNPLFVEQFAAWADDTRYGGRGPCPRNLHQVIAARIRHLEEVRVRDLRLRASWGGALKLYDVSQELDDIESEIGLWLDRLETGDYADRAEVARYLTTLENIDFELFLISTIAGRPRVRSNRLREAIERLFMGSADRILKDMMDRVRSAGGAEDVNLGHEAVRFGEYCAANYRWDLAVRFYKLAIKVSSSCDKPALSRRLDELAQYLNVAARPGPPMDSSRILEELESHPAVDSLRLPEVWLKLGQRLSSPCYYLRAAEAADLVNNRAVCALARGSAANVQVG